MTLARAVLDIVASDALTSRAGAARALNAAHSQPSASVRSGIGSLILCRLTLQLVNDGDCVAAPSHGLLNSYVDFASL